MARTARASRRAFSRRSPSTERDVGADVRVLRDVAIEAVAHLDLEVLGGDVVEELSRLGSSRSTSATTLSSL